MKKNYTINIRLSKEEKDIMLEKAKKCGLKLGQYLRFLGLRTNIREVSEKV
jgi:hypothetical protein